MRYAHESISRRRFLTAAGAVGAGVSLSGLAACGGGSGSGSLVFWDNLLGGATDVPKKKWFITKAIAQFEKPNAGTTVKRSSQSTDIATWHDQFRAASIARNGPDVVTIFAGSDVQTFAPYLLPLDDAFSADARKQLLGWDSVRKDFKANGTIVAAPFGAGSYFEVMYNKHVFESAGVRFSSPPRTWEDLLQLGGQLKKAGVTPIVMGEQEGDTGAWIMATLVGGEIGTDGFFEMRNHKRQIDSPEMVRGYENYRKLQTMELVNSDAASLKGQEAQQRFLQGKGAMFFQGGWFNMQAVDGLGAKVDNFPIPTLAGARFAGGIAGGPNEALAVTKYAKNQKAAIKFIKFLLQADILDEYVSISQTESSNNKKADTSVIRNVLLKNQTEWLKKYPTIYPFDNIMPQQVNDEFYRTNAAVFSGHTSPSAAAKHLQKTFDSLS